MFFIVWQGLGAYALVIPLFLVVGAYLAVYVLFGVETAARFGTAVSGIALLASAGLLRWMTIRLTARPVRHLVDRETGEEVTLRQKHTMFYVPLRYWRILYAVIGVVAVVAGLLQATGVIRR